MKLLTFIFEQPSYKQMFKSCLRKMTTFVLSMIKLVNIFILSSGRLFSLMLWTELAIMSLRTGKVTNILYITIQSFINSQCNYNNATFAGTCTVNISSDKISKVR